MLYPLSATASFYSPQMFCVRYHHITCDASVAAPETFVAIIAIPSRQLADGSRVSRGRWMVRPLLWHLSLCVRGSVAHGAVCPSRLRNSTWQKDRGCSALMTTNLGDRNGKRRVFYARVVVQEVYVEPQPEVDCYFLYPNHELLGDSRNSL